MGEITIWFAIIFPLIGTIVASHLFNEKYTWFEYLYPSVVVFIFILTFSLIYKSSLQEDTEYLGSTVTKAVYTEYYETYIHKTCSRQVACGTYTTGSGKHRTTHTRYRTEYYDCSYCDENPAHWDVVDNLNHTYSISKEEFYRLYTTWHNINFVELNRDIDYSGGCGKDGNEYVTKWNGDQKVSKNITVATTYTNPTLNALSSFNFRELDTTEIKQHNLFEYPELNGRDQNNILGYPFYLPDSTKNRFRYLNGWMGSINKGRYYILFYPKNNISSGILQEVHWKRGNQNEITICIGLDTLTNNVTWVHSFGWNHNKYLFSRLNSDIFNMKYMDFNKLLEVITTDSKYYKLSDLKRDFSYLKPEFSTTAYAVIYIFSILLTITLLIVGYKTDV